MEGERLRLRVPERVGPIRNLAALAGRPEATAPASPTRAPEVGAEADAARGPALGASLGYRVIEDYLRQGRDTAERLGLAVAGGAGAASFQGLSERLLRDGLLWLEYVAKFWAALDPPRGPGKATPAAGTVAPARGLRVRMASRAPVEVALELRPEATGRALGVHELRCPDPSTPSLDGVELAAEADVEGLCVALRVADGQPPGLYTGVVFDRGDGSVQGTLSVRVETEAGS
jgi:hypothetical protein